MTKAERERLLAIVELLEFLARRLRQEAARRRPPEKKPADG